MSKRYFYIGTLAVVFTLGSAIYAAIQNFVPDVTFKGSALTGWHKLGQADWRAENGEIIGTPKQESGGWLVLDKGLQDVQFYASFRCSGPCKAGVLLRAEKTAEGMKGVYVSLSDGDIGSYEVRLDAQGNELSRTRLASSQSGPLNRLSKARPSGPEDLVPGFSKPAPDEIDWGKAPAPRPAAGAGGQGARGGAGAAAGPGRGGRGGVTLRADDWNTVQVILDADLLSMGVNGGRGGGGGATTDKMMGFGPIALYAGGASAVRFKEVSYKDLNTRFEPKEVVSPNFRMQRISDFYYAWCAAAADINHDGILDVIAGPYYYLGPDYTQRKELTIARTYSPSTQFSQGMVNFAYDFTGDGWPDVLMVDQRPIYLYVNPRGESRRWDRYNVVPDAASEIELLKDIDGDGKPEVLYGVQGGIAYAKPDPANPTARWIVQKVSEGVGVVGHGMGVGDINGDGRMDIVGPGGWWEQPAKIVRDQAWTLHPAQFGPGAEMGIYDVNGDGLKDVVTAVNAHGWGLAWFEQRGCPDFR